MVSVREDEAKPTVLVFNIFKQVRVLIAAYEHTQMNPKSSPTVMTTDADVTFL